MADGIRVDRLDALMQARGYGPGELAEQAGVSYNYVYKIRKGRAKHIAATQVAKIAAALRTSSGYLLGVTDDSTPEPAPAQLREQFAVAPKMLGGVYGLVVNEARPAYTADVAGIAERLRDLPAARRAQAVDVIEGVLALAQEVAPAVATQAPFAQQLAAYVDDLSTEDQQAVLDAIRELRARLDAGAPTDGRQTSG